MKLTTRCSAFVLALAMALSLVACGSPAPTSSSASSGVASLSSQPAPESSSAPASTEAAPAEGPVTVTDHLGREVTFASKPERIVSGYYITSSMLIALGLREKTVGIEAKAGSRPIYALAAPEMLKLPSVGTAKEFDLEGCIALKPDLVILPIKLKDSVSALEKAGVNVLAVNPEDMVLLKETAAMIGKATGTDEQAARLSAYYDEKIAELSRLNTDDPSGKTVYLAGNSDLLSTATAKMYQNSLIETAGGKNVAAEIDDTYWATISYEQLIAYDPDLIVIVPSASYSKDDVLKDTKLAGLKAIKSGAVYQMPDKFEAWDSPVPSGILGAMWLASILHEEKYPFDEFRSDAAAFYQNFYGVAINTEDLTK